jgi:hypothetical protein
MSHFTNRLAAALLIASIAVPVAASESADALDIHAEDYTAAGGPVRSSFVAGVGMVDQAETRPVVAEIKED